MVRSSVRVLIRTRPSQAINPNLQIQSDKKTVVVVTPKTASELKGGPAQGPGGSQYQFKFDAVLNDVSQEDVYEAAAADVLQSALEGYNGTILCYGQTGAGKTYTMSGGRQNFKQRGLIPRVLTQLFTEIRNLTDTECKVTVTFLEIYNDQMYDLLDITTQPHEIVVHERPGANGTSVTVGGLKSCPVNSEGEALQLVFEGETNRVIGEHQLNRESSRSHSIFTVQLEMRATGSPTVTTSKLHLVDLAGSERVSKTRSEGSVLREAGHINKSLSILEQVILALSEKGRDHVPFRNSRLTHVLRDSLGGNCKTVLIANVWGDAGQTDETLSTCRFAQRMARISCEITPNISQDGGAVVKQLQRQVADLQAELAMHDAMAGRQAGAMTYGPYTPQQRQLLQEQVAAFLAPGSAEDSIEPLELLSIRHIKEVLLCVKSMYRARVAALPPPGTSPAAAEGSASPGLTSSSGRAGAAAGGKAAPSPSKASSSGTGSGAAGGVGDLSADEQGGGVGVAPDDARPALDSEEDGAQPRASTSGQQSNGGSKAAAGGPFAAVPPDLNVALQAFKVSGAGAAKAALLADNKARLRATKKKAKDLGLSINAAKRELDASKARADELKAARQAKGGEAATILEPEEMAALSKIKDLKQQYRDQFSELQMVKSEVDYTQQLVTTCTQEALDDFKQWFTDTYGMAPNSSPSTLELDADLADGVEGPLSPSAASTMSNTQIGSVGSVAAASPGAAVRQRMGAAQASPAAGTASPATRKAPVPVAPTRASPSPARRPPAGPKPRPVLPQPEPDELTDPEAAAFYAAQQKMIERTTGVAHRPGSSKKRMGQDMGFSTTNRADITAKTSTDVFTKGNNPVRGDK